MAEVRQRNRIFSLQGCMAVGKTSVLRYLEKQYPQIHVSYEDNADVIFEIRKRKLDKNREEDFYEIQRLFLQNEIRRFKESADYPCQVMDFGAEEIIFYTLNYPVSIGKNWRPEEALKTELEAVRVCLPERILYLKASPEILQQRKKRDFTRSRQFFSWYLEHLLPLKESWLYSRKDTDVLDTNTLSLSETGEAVASWVLCQLDKEG